MLRAVAASVTCAVLLSSSAVRAAGPAEHNVDFRANQVELEADARSLDLKGDVVIRSERFRLTSERLSLHRSARGVHVEGSGVLALCPCPNPPIAFGLRAADLAPPSDVLIESATLRVFGLPVFWSPYLWLRSPNRSGLLPPFIGYRGEEGLLLGTGVHWPFAAQSPRSLDLSAAGYVLGGARLEGRFVGPGARVQLSFDQFRGSALDLRATLSDSGNGGSFGALRTDWLAGGRALVAPTSIERVVLPSDRLRFTLGRADKSVFGLSLHADAPRGALLGELGSVGPALSFGTGGALGRRARYALFAATESAHASRGDWFAARLWFELEASAALGPFRQSVGVRERLGYDNVFERQSRAVEHETRARFGLPLARRYAELTHTLAPYVEAALVANSQAGDEAPLAARSGARWLALAGAKSALGGLRATGASIELVAGASGDERTTSSVVAARARSDAALLRVGWEGRAVPRDRAVDTLLRAELGRRDSWRLLVHTEGLRGDVSPAARVFADDYLLPLGARLDRSGWGAGARLAAPLVALISGEVGSEFDLSHEEWLASWAALRYRHPCRCMAVTLAGARRIGRRGVDIGFNLELIPP